MTSNESLGIGVAGIRGFAKGLADTIRTTGAKTDPPARLAAVADPALEQHPERVAELNQAGTITYARYDELLADPQVEAVWLPVPIALHRPFTEQALAAGKPVMCEKPVAGTVDEVDAMIAARDRAGLPALVGFQSIYEPATAELKRQLLAGAIGTVRRASVWGCWPRSSNYFARTDWAGRLRQGGQWVLDSPLQNAMAHYVNLPLFLLGSTFQESGTPVAVEAELYRAAPIENYDTVSARVRLADGPSLLVMLTHASKTMHHPIIRIEGDAGTAIWHARHGATITNASGEQQLALETDPRGNAVRTFVRLVRGRSIEPLAVATLEVARAHTVVVNGTSEAAPVKPVPESALRRITDEQTGAVVHTIPQIETVFEQCAADWHMLHEARAFAFTSPPGRRDLCGYHHFAGPHPETAPPVETTANQ